MRFTIADTCMKSLARLTAEERKSAKADLIDFQMNPAAPGFSYEKLQRAKDKNMRAARISGDLRLIVHQLGQHVCACYVGHHDDALRWGETHVQEAHPETGAMQIIEVVEVPRQIFRDEYVNAPLFRRYDDSYLLKLGVPVMWLDAVRTVSDEDGLLALIERLPNEAGERLLLLHDGKPVPTPEPLTGIDPYEHPDAQRRFRTIQNRDELTEALEYPWERWMVFLHPTQRKMVERKYKGPARVSGAAGTGKTVVALHRAAHLAGDGGARILLTTYSRTLAFRLAHQADILLGNRPEARKSITVEHVHKTAREIWTWKTGGPFHALSGEELSLTLDRAYRSARSLFPFPFVKNEWENVIAPGNIRTWEQYRRAPRVNRGTSLGARQRQGLWTIFEAAQKSLQERGLMSWEQLCFEAAGMAEGQNLFEHVIADEYQDLGPAELTFLRALTPDVSDALFLCGDSGQRIYKGAVSWLSLGIDVRGRSSSLTVNYRTTEQIRRFADRLLCDTADGSTGETEDRKSVSLLSGPEPQVQGCATVAEEVANAGRYLRNLLAEGIKPAEIAIFVHGKTLLRDRAGAACREAGVPSWELSDDSLVDGNGVFIGTMHRAKGLEFRAVIVMGCEDKLMPMKSVLDRKPDQADRDEFVEQERRLLYVACTRARERLLLTYTGTKSRFLS